MIIGSCNEYTGDPDTDDDLDMEPRLLGLAMVPGHHIARMWVDNVKEPVRPTSPAAEDEESWYCVISSLTTIDLCPVMCSDSRRSLIKFCQIYNVDQYWSNTNNLVWFERKILFEAKLCFQSNG